MRLKIFFLAWIMMIVVSAAAFADDGPDVRATVSKRTVTIGDRIRYAIEARYGKNISVVFPVFTDKKIGDFEIKDSGKTIEKIWFGRTVEARWYSMAAYSVGKFLIPETQVLYTVKGETERRSVPVKAIEVSVESVLPKGAAITDIKDIKGPIQARDIGKFLALSAFLVTIISLAILAYRKIRSRKPVRLPHETALEELQALKVVFFQSGDIKSYYVGISDSVRRYIERAFRFRAPEMTTEEFLDSLKSSSSLSQEQKSLLKDFMGSCDLVKFAKYAPTKDEAGLVFTTAAKFIEETKDVHI
ncbi:MAG: hypothetical protein NTZ95_02565 [Candidatus Omnitrophica bacterium]|nr:hypothetical protein [Candidatus Omnitrophota bacterium]